MNSEVTMTLARIDPCRCAGHVLAVLRSADERLGVPVRVSHDLGAALAQQLGGMRGTAGPIADAVLALMEELGARPEAVAVARRRERGRPQLSLSLRVVVNGATRELLLDPGVALLLAEHLRLPILVELPAHTRQGDHGHVSQHEDGELRVLRDVRAVLSELDGGSAGGEHD